MEGLIIDPLDTLDDDERALLRRVRLANGHGACFQTTRAIATRLEKKGLVRMRPSSVRGFFRLELRA